MFFMVINWNPLTPLLDRRGKGNFLSLFVYDWQIRVLLTPKQTVTHDYKFDLNT